jgi:hypothetical protein
MVLAMAGLMLAPLPALSQGAPGSYDQGGRRDRVEDLLRDLGGGMGEGMGGGSRGAVFLLRSGDATVAVRCDPQDSMRACIDAAGMFMEKARSAATGASTGTPAPSSGARP